MRLLDEDSDRALKKVALYLTVAEARKVRKALDQLGARLEAGRVEHVHVDDREYEHHLTLVLYSPDDADSFEPRYRRLIREDR
jgi:NAD(P)H-dependent FMN reductase